MEEDDTATDMDEEYKDDEDDEEEAVAVAEEVEPEGWAKLQVLFGRHSYDLK